MAVIAAVFALAGCGGGSSGDGDSARNVPKSGGLQAKVREASAPKASEFPSVDGRSLQEVADSMQGGPEVGLAGQTYITGDNRLAFGVIDSQGKFVYGKTAVYIAPTPDAPAQGPFPAPADVLVTDPAFRSRQAASETDLFAAVYGADVKFSKPGNWTLLTATQSGGGLLAAPSQVKVVKPGKDDIPQVGEAAPRVETDTIASAKGDEESIDTRIPTAPELHQESFADVVGKKPVALLFATPQLCQSRVCGPVTDIALQMKAKYGDKMTFIHQEVYNANDANKGLRAPLTAFKLESEPWLFVIDKRGRITARLEGSFGLDAFENAVKTGL